MKIGMESITRLEIIQEEISKIEEKYPDKNYSNTDKTKLINLNAKSKVLMQEIKDNHNFFIHRQIKVDELVTELLN